MSDVEDGDMQVDEGTDDVADVGAAAADDGVPMEIDAPKAEAPKMVTEATLDLEAYIAPYAGHTKVLRLRFIAEHCLPLRVEALRLARNELRTGQNPRLEAEVAQQYHDACVAAGVPAEAVPTKQYIDECFLRQAQLREKLDQELKLHRNTMVKETIRVAYLDLGEHHYKSGDLKAASNCFTRARDYCQSPAHRLQVCLRVLKVAIEQPAWNTVFTYVNKALQDTPDTTSAGLLGCYHGLAHLANDKFKDAARCFLQVPYEESHTYNGIISQRDIAIYGGLCALAAFERSDLKRRVIENTGFKQFLELTPTLRELIRDFYFSRYPSCLAHLKSLKADMYLDMHLHPFVDQLYKQIRDKALVQYFSPFVSVDMNKMAQAFNTTTSDLELELIDLIGNGKIQARIDSDKKVLYARQVNERINTFKHALKVGKEYEVHVTALLLRQAMTKANMLVRGFSKRHWTEMDRPLSPGGHHAPSQTELD